MKTIGKKLISDEIHEFQFTSKEIKENGRNQHYLIVEPKLKRRFVVVVVVYFNILIYYFKK